MLDTIIYQRHRKLFVYVKTKFDKMNFKDLSSFINLKYNKK